MNQSQQMIENLVEMAMPRPKDLARTYYHGTSKEKAGKAIMRKGIQPPDLTLRPVTNLTPVAGKVYLTPDIGYATIYALGGSMIGHDMSGMVKPKGRGDRYGYLFVVSGKQLKGIQPDEDSVGEMIYDGTAPMWLVDMVEAALADEWTTDVAEDPETGEEFDMPRPVMDALRDGEYEYFALAGKTALADMTDAEKLELIDLGAHVAHTGKIKPKQAWRIDKLRSLELKADASNFFKIAEKVK